MLFSLIVTFGLSVAGSILGNYIYEKLREEKNQK